MVRDDIIVALDIGSSKIKTLIARQDENTLDIIGIGSSEANGVRRGLIINIDAASDSIAKSLEEAENMAGIEVTKVVAGIGGDHISGLNSRGVIGVNTKSKEVTVLEIERVLESARSVHFGNDREIIEVIEQEYSLDGQDEIKNPVGMVGTRLESEVHIISGLRSASDSIIKALKRLHIDPIDIVASIRASSEAIINDDEKQLGVVVIDFGYATTSVIVYLEGSVWHTSVLPIGSSHITSDIAAGLRLTIPMAEQIKIDYGFAFADLVGDEEVIEIPSITDKQNKIMYKKILAKIIQPRVEEILSLVQREVQKLNCDTLITAGTVFTGGGADLAGLIDLAESYSKSMTAARIGIPHSIGGITDILEDTSYSAAAGLLKMTAAKIENMPSSKKKSQNDKAPSKFKNPLKEFFN